eukprot:505513-Pelagomonas_calceolata.AAC.4
MLLRYHAPFGAGESVGGKNPLVVPSSSISAALHAAGLVSKRQKQKQPKPTSDPQPQSSKKSQKAKEAKEAREALQSERKRNRCTLCTAMFSCAQHASNEEAQMAVLFCSPVIHNSKQRGVGFAQ